MSTRRALPCAHGPAASLRFRRGMDGWISGAAGLLLVAVLGAGLCYGAAAEGEKYYDGKVVAVDARSKVLEIEYTGAKGAVQVDVDSVRLADVTGRLARIEVFKPGVPIRVKVKETSTMRLTDPTKPPSKDNPPKTSVEKVIREIGMAASSGTTPAATPAATPATTSTGTPTHSSTPATKPATPATPAATTTTKPAITTKPAKSAALVPPGSSEVLNAPPDELAALPLPKGNALLVTLAASPEYQAEQITLRLKCYKVSVTAPEVQCDSAAVFYVTEDADLTAGDRDLSGPLGTITYWKDLLESTNTFLPFTGHNKQEVSAGIAKFLPTVPMVDRRVAVSGTLKAPIEKLCPRAMALVLMNGSKPVSNVVWFTLGRNAPAPPPAPKAVAPAPAPAPAVAPKQAARATFAP